MVYRWLMNGLYTVTGWDGNGWNMVFIIHNIQEYEIIFTLVCRHIHVYIYIYIPTYTYVDVQYRSNNINTYNCMCIDIYIHADLKPRIPTGMPFSSGETPRL